MKHITVVPCDTVKIMQYEHSSDGITAHAASRTLNDIIMNITIVESYARLIGASIEIREDLPHYDAALDLLSRLQKRGA